MARATAWPILTAESGLSRYLSEIKRFPMLEPGEEYMLAKRWREHGDREAAHMLVTSHLRQVAKIAMGYRGYGLPIGKRNPAPNIVFGTVPWMIASQGTVLQPNQTLMAVPHQ